MEREQLAKVIIAIFGGPIAALLITPIFCFFRKMFYVPFIRKKLVQDAVAKGHVVTARLIRTHDIKLEDDFGRISSGSELGVYQYECRGKTYRRRLITADRMPEEIHLYYQRNPRKATVELEVGLHESNWWLYYAVISVLCMIGIAAFWVIHNA